MLSVSLEYLIIKNKMRNSELYQYPVPQNSNFYPPWRLLKKLYKVCTNNQDNNEYLAVKYILDFLPTTLYDVCNVMFIN